jgi:hypothetical protein
MKFSRQWRHGTTRKERKGEAITTTREGGTVMLQNPSKSRYKESISKP